MSNTPNGQTPPRRPFVPQRGHRLPQRPNPPQRPAPARSARPPARPAARPAVPNRPAEQPPIQPQQPTQPNSSMMNVGYLAVIVLSCVMIGMLIHSNYPIITRTQEQTAPSEIIMVPKDPHASLPKPAAPEPAEQRYVKVPQETIDLALKRNVYITAKDKRDIGYCGSGGRIGNGLILTARHVVFEKLETKIPKTEIEVDHVAATILAEDLATDIAVLRIPDDGFTPVVIAYDAELIKLNTPVVFIGNPRGRKNTLQTGIVSRLESPENGSNMFEVLTFDADHGTSGSVIYTLDGRLIGVSQMGDADDTIRLGIVRNLLPVEKLLNTLKGTR